MKWIAALALVASVPASAQDLDVTLHVEGGPDVMLTGVYRDRFDWGGHVAGRAGLEVIGPLAVQIGFATAWFPVEGQEPGNLYDITLGARGFFLIEEISSGPWIDANAGVGITGDLVRFTFDAGLGFDFFPHEVFGVGPFARYTLIVQPDGESVGDDAHMIAFGVQLTVRIPVIRPQVIIEEHEPEPEPDRDGDLVPDPRDACADEPEDRDSIRDEDGCPDLDDDGDGIHEPDDRCPAAAEVRNGFEDDDGCPDEAGEQPRRVISGEILPQRVYFRLGSDRIQARNADALREVCALLASRPETRIRVIGHADEQGTPAGNHRLGASRAGAVAEALVNCGVGPERLESFSYGDTRRECDASDEECRQRNRRVVFELLPE